MEINGKRKSYMLVVFTLAIVIALSAWLVLDPSQGALAGCGGWRC